MIYFVVGSKLSPLPVIHIMSYTIGVYSLWRYLKTFFILHIWNSKDHYQVWDQAMVLIGDDELRGAFDVLEDANTPEFWGIMYLSFMYGSTK